MGVASISAASVASLETPFQDGQNLFAITMSARAYRLLNLRPRPAPSVEQIKAAFRKAALVYHPDLPKGCAKTFIDIQAAHDELLEERLGGSSSHAWTSGDNGRSKEKRWQYASDSETTEEAKARREYEELLREARRRREEDMRPPTREEEALKWRYFRLVLFIFGAGAVVKLAIFKAVAIARAHALTKELKLRAADDPENKNDGPDELLTVRATAAQPDRKS